MTDLSIRNGDLNLAASVRGGPAASPVLLLHGLAGSRDTWEEAVDRLADRYEVWTVDFRGHGHSDRSPSYLIQDYVSDAEAVLEVIGRPTVVAGHSLGAVTAGVLAQRPHPLVVAALLEDPPWYLGEPAEWEQGVYRTLFPLLRDQQVSMQAERAPLRDWLAAAGRAPAPQGGTAADHMDHRQLLSSASARQRHDPAAWDSAIGHAVFAAHDPDVPLRVPVTVLQADPELGPAFMAHHEARLRATSPDVVVVRYDGAGHRIHAERAHAARFLDDLDKFVAEHAV